MLGPCWGYVELCWDHLGAKLAHLGAMLGLWLADRSMLAHFEVLLGLCWPVWGLCWGQVRPSWAMLGLWLRYFHDVTFIPKFCFKKLSPAACESELFVEDFLSSTSPQCLVPASFTFRAFSLPPVACEPLEVSFGLVAAMLGSCSRHFFQKVFSPSTMTVFEAILGPCWTHHEAHLNRFGAMLKNWL